MFHGKHRFPGGNRPAARLRSVPTGKPRGTVGIVTASVGVGAQLFTDHSPGRRDGGDYPWPAGAPRRRTSRGASGRSRVSVPEWSVLSAGRVSRIWFSASLRRAAVLICPAVTGLPDPPGGPPAGHFPVIAKTRPPGWPRRLSTSGVSPCGRHQATWPTARVAAFALIYRLPVPGHPGVGAALPPSTAMLGI
jgi:hypothetical protein